MRKFDIASFRISQSEIQVHTILCSPSLFCCVQRDVSVSGSVENSKDAIVIECAICVHNF